MYSSLQKICLTFGMFLVLATSLAAQGTRNEPSDLTSRFQLADAYIRSGQLERAVAILEDVYARDAGSYAVYDKLLRTYEGLKRYEEAISLVDKRVALTGATPDLLSDKASLQYSSGQEDDAFATWDEATAIAPKSQQTYRTVYFSLNKNRLFEKAIEVLEEGRSVTGLEGAFRTDLAYMYNQVGDHASAAKEYVGLILESPKQASLAKRQLSRFTDKPAVIDSSIVVVEEFVIREPLDPALREFAAWLYMEGGYYADAFKSYRALDRLGSANGRYLFIFAQNASDAGAYVSAGDAYNAILSQYGDTPAAGSAQLGLARMLVRQAADANEQALDSMGNRIPTPLYDAAIDGYKAFTNNYPGSPEGANALHELALIYQDTYFSLGEAEGVHKEVIRRFPGSDAASRSQYDLGRISLQRGDLRNARIAFARLESDLEIGELAELAQYETALTDFYLGKFESSLTTVSALDANTSRDIANDAISLKIMLRENKGPDSLNTPLRLYSTARLLDRQRDFAMALVYVDSVLAGFPEHALNDEATFLRGRALYQMGRIEEAIAVFSAFPASFPLSYLCDRSLNEMGKALEAESGRVDEAIEVYTKLLVDYPGSLLAPGVRSRIRKLRGDEL